MKRDDELIRTLLLSYEENEDWLIMMPGSTMGSSKQERLERAHVLLLMDEGLLITVGQDTFRLTSSGHDYLQVIRNETVWHKTKDGAAKVGGMTLGMMKDLAIAYVKQEASLKLGIPL